MPVITYREAVRAALAEEMERDPTVFIMGEEVAQYNGAYKVTEGLLERFGPRRVIDTPISEAGFAGIGVGAAMYGLRPVVEFMTWSFSYVAIDQIINNAANVRYMSGGQIKCPVVFRGPANGGVNVGATHSHTPENVFATFPGLKVVCPSTPRDAKGLLKSAIRDNDPVCVMESTILYNTEGEVPADDSLVPIGRADIKRPGTDLSLIAHGRGVLHALGAAQLLKEKHGIEAEVVDLRSIRPLDKLTILESVRRTHRAVLVDENKPFCSVSSHVGFVIQEEAFDDLDAPVKKVNSLDVPQPYNDRFEKMVLPSAERVYKTCLEIL